MPTFADYHRTVIGYHGTLREHALRIVTGERSFKPSQNYDDWLGHGVYFWEYAPKQAWQWARKRYGAGRGEIAVIGAMIRLSACFDLLDPDNAVALSEMHRSYLRACKETGASPRRNVRSSKRLDCAVFEYAFAAMAESQSAVDTVRAVYVPTQGKDRLWEQSWLYHHTHIQLCVRNPSCILGAWLVRPETESSK